ncbi:MAG: riboflavin synthase [Gammaproteobacteria bacterium]|nr:riboflavin synthase [Gammaproteobacteria bacterium]NND36696.1 riboflavin synthase [Gammaproteobacteria bacterium]
MFTGIIQAIGEIRAVEAIGGDARLRIGVGDLSLDRVALGDSIAVNGVCLTVIEFAADEFAADVSQETLQLTTLGHAAAGSRVNLEPSLTLATPLGGHLVSGHVDGVGEVAFLAPDARSTRIDFAMPEVLARYVAKKGSIAIDGTSLTVNEVGERKFSVNLVPHTLERTIMRRYEPGTRVNLEVDLVARYLERLNQV